MMSTKSERRKRARPITSRPKDCMASPRNSSICPSAPPEGRSIPAPPGRENSGGIAFGARPGAPAPCRQASTAAARLREGWPCRTRSCAPGRAPGCRRGKSSSPLSQSPSSVVSKVRRLGCAERSNCFSTAPGVGRPPLSFQSPLSRRTRVPPSAWLSVNPGAGSLLLPSVLVCRATVALSRPDSVGFAIAPQCGNHSDYTGAK